MDWRNTYYYFNKYVYSLDSRPLDPHPLDPPKKKEYYNRVYLCIEKETQSSLIRGFQCFSFSTFDEAEREQEKRSKNQKSGKVSANRVCFIPICRWVPFFMDRMILDYRLKSIFWMGRHTLYRKQK